MNEDRSYRPLDMLRKSIDKFGNAPEKAIAMELGHIADALYVECPKLLEVLCRIADALEKGNVKK
jgi:hypothetical protein